MIYNTQQLAAILKNEFLATIKGDRAVLTSPIKTFRLEDGKVQMLRDFEAEATSYQEIAAQVHNYQHVHGISGLEERTVTFPDGVTASFPFQIHELDLIDSDIETLRSAVPTVVKAWLDWLKSDPMVYFCHQVSTPDAGYIELQLTIDAVERFFCWGPWDWAELAECIHGVDLTLGTGQPGAAMAINSGEMYVSFKAELACELINYG